MGDRADIAVRQTIMLFNLSALPFLNYIQIDLHSKGMTSTAQLLD